MRSLTEYEVRKSALDHFVGHLQDVANGELERDDSLLFLCRRTIMYASSDAVRGMWRDFLKECGYAAELAEVSE